ncbi:MAG TPA: hypothetical protein VHD83_21875 [Puia sp.]|nr:hypothetical protein [Puia sp.]
MNKKLCAWIEGDGTFRMLFRKLALWDFASADRCKVQLLIAIEKEKMMMSANGVQFAVERRKKEVQLLTHYLPLFVVFMTSLAYISLATIFHVFPHYYLGLVLSLSLIIVYKHTWFSQYVETCRYIYTAADSLLKELSVKEFPALPTVLPSVGSVTILEPAMVQPDLQKPFLSANFEEVEQVDPMQDAETGPQKSNIILFLLDELIKKECNRPNIHSGTLKETIIFFSASSGCQAKNIITKAHTYRTRNAIKLSSENARTTHLRYINILLEHYKSVGDIEMYQQAENLLTFITHIGID